MTIVMLLRAKNCSSGCALAPPAASIARIVSIVRCTAGPRVGNALAAMLQRCVEGVIRSPPEQRGLARSATFPGSRHDDSIRRPIRVMAFLRPQGAAKHCRTDL